MRRNLIPAIVLALLCFLFACKKSEDVTVAGKGGDATLQIKPSHGSGEEVDNCMIYIKYNTLDMPANGVYDDSLLCNIVDGAPLAVFTDLHRGNYYLYGKGFNPDHNDEVKGGMPFHIDNESGLYKLSMVLGH